MEIFISVITVVVNLLLGFVTLWKNPKSSSNRLLALLTLNLAFYAIANYYSLHADSAEATLLWIRIVMVGGSFMGPIIYLLVSAFPNQEVPISRYTLYSIWLFACITAGFALSPYLFTSVIYEPGNIQPQPGPAIPIFALNFLGFIVFSGVTLVHKYRRSTGVTRTQIRYLLAGIILTFSLMALTAFILVNLFHNSAFVVFGPFSTLIFVGCVSYAIVRHRFLEIKLAIRGALIYVTASIVLLAFILASSLLSGWFAPETVTSERLMTIIIGAFAVTLFFPTIFKLSAAVWDSLYFGRTLTHQDSLMTLAKRLPKILDLTQLSDLILDTLIKTMGLNRAALLVLDYETKQYRISKMTGFGENNGIVDAIDDFLPQHFDENPNSIVLEEMDKIILDTHSPEDREKWKRLVEQMIVIEAAVIIPVLSVDKMISLIVLGNKKGGDAYSVEDLRLLDVIASQAAVAIENARLYKEISELNHNLQDRVNSVTVQLQKRNYELEQANVDLKSLDKMKDQLIAITSHELRTPASNVQNYLWMTLTKPDPATILAPKEKERLQRALNAVQRLIRLINDILDVSKIEGGKLEIKLQSVHYEDVVRSVIEDFTIKVQQNRLRLSVEKVPGTAPAIMADPLRLKEVLDNLIGNAIKYTDHGSVHVVISQSGDMIQIAVQDTGRGIQKEHLQSLFKKFYREDASLSASNPQTGGTGLGLYITKALVELMRGEITVKSESGRGSVFTVSFPVAIGDVIADAPSKKAFREIFTESDYWKLKEGGEKVRQTYIPPSLVSPASVSAKKRILLVEDEAEMRAFYADYLSALYDVSAAVDGEDALTKLILHRYDVVLLDVMMPKLDGIGFLTRKQTIQAISSVPVILLTNLGEEEALAKCFELGARAMIMKSDVTPDQIPPLIEKVIESQQGPYRF